MSAPKLTPKQRTVLATIFNGGPYWAEYPAKWIGTLRALFKQGRRLVRQIRGAK